MTSSSNKVALVTGGSRGLGKDMALQLAGKGFDVILTYNNNKEAADQVVKEIQSLGRKASSIQLNVSEFNNYDQFVSDVKSRLKSEFNSNHLHSLVNNAGVGTHASVDATTYEQFDDMVDIHLKAPYFITQKLLPVIQDGGTIVNISSGLARFSAPNFSAYGIMKAGVESLTRYQALELGPRKIRVNTVAPGAIETDFGGGFVRDNKEMNTAIANSTALGRVGVADDIGGVVAFLCSQDAKWVNAQRLEVSGGYYI